MISSKIIKNELRSKILVPLIGMHLLQKSWQFREPLSYVPLIQLCGVKILRLKVIRMWLFHGSMVWGLEVENTLTSSLLYAATSILLVKLGWLSIIGLLTRLLTFKQREVLAEVKSCCLGVANVLC